MTLEKSLGSDLFQIDVSYYGTGAVITLAGELDVASSPELVNALQGAALDVADSVELDMERLVCSFRPISGWTPTGVF